jgi:hypothetical protein
MLRFAVGWLAGPVVDGEPEADAGVCVGCPMMGYPDEPQLISGNQDPGSSWGPRIAAVHTSSAAST